MESKTVVVTGASGFLAGEIINQLTAKGFSVRGTVRSLQNPEKISHLTKLFPNLKLFEADLLNVGSFDAAFYGADFVVHTASPFLMNVTDPQKELIDPAVNGTKNVLESVRKNPSVKKVVVTSSGAAVVEQFHEDVKKAWTEDDWNTTSTLKDGPYRLSKTLAEKYAYEWSEKNPQTTLVTICPTFIIGPPLSDRTDATSIKVIKELMDGTAKSAGGVIANSIGFIDVRNVARAHVVALEKNNIKGRFILSSEKPYTRFSYLEILKKEYPDWPLPDKMIGEIKPIGGNLINGTYSNLKAKNELEIEFFSLEKSLLDMTKKLIELGILTKPQ